MMHMQQLKQHKLSLILALTLFISCLLPVHQAQAALSAGQNNNTITIDGHFDDWHTAQASSDLAKWQTDNFTVHQVGLKSDGTNVYLYVNMAPFPLGAQGQYTKMQPANYKLALDDKVFWLTFKTDNLLNSAQTNHIYPFDVKVWGENANNQVNTDVHDAGRFIRQSITTVSGANTD